MRIYWIALAIVVAIITSCVGLLVTPLVFAHRVLPGVHVDGVDLSGVNLDDLEGALVQYAQILLGRELTVQLRGHTVTRTLGQLGFELDVASTARELVQQSWIRSDWIQEADPVVRLDAVRARSVLHNAFSGQLSLPVSASLKQVGNKFVLVPSVSGEQVDIAAFEQDVLGLIRGERSSPIQPSIISDAAPVQDHEVARAQTLASHLLQKGFTLTFGDEELAIKPYTLRRLVAFGEQTDPHNPSNTILGVKLDQEGLRTYLESTIEPEINREPVNARFVVQRSDGTSPSFDLDSVSSGQRLTPTFIDGVQAAPAPQGAPSGPAADSSQDEDGGADVRVVQFAAPRQGRMLDVESSVESIQQALAQGKTSASLAIIVTEPDITDSIEADKLGINTLLAVGESNFRGSPRNRVHNIRVGAERYHGLLVAPGGEFSFNKFLGPVNASSGFKPELVIKKNVTIPEYGGGLCQVSTTAFRAAVSSGMEILQRRNHAYAVSYYGTPGFDATIYPPYTDLRFLNNTPGYILIQTKIEGTKLIFEFWGTDDGREVEIVGPSLYNRTQDGAVKAVLTQRVMRDGETIIEDTFYSNYKSPKLFPKVLSANAEKPPKPEAKPVDDKRKEKKENATAPGGIPSEDGREKTQPSPSTPTPTSAATQDKDAAKQETN